MRALLFLVRRSLRQHALSTAITLGAVALASGLVMAVFSIESQARSAFTGGETGFDAVLGGRGSELQLVLNSVFHLESSPGNVPWTLYQEVKARPFVDPGRIGVFGWSYGGYMTLMLLGQSPGSFKAGVAGAPVTDFRLYDTHYTERYLGTPEENPEGYRLSNVLTWSGAIRDRLMIIHGMADENVHFRHTARLLNVLNPAHRRYDLLIYPDERHLPRGQSDREELEARVVAHFDRSLAAGAMATAPAR